MPSARERMRSIRELARRDIACRTACGEADTTDVTGFTPVTVWLLGRPQFIDAGQLELKLTGEEGRLFEG